MTPQEDLIEVGINVLHYLDNLDQTTFCASGLREQLRDALYKNGVAFERITSEGNDEL